MKSAQSESVVVEVGPHAFSVKVSLAQDVNKQPQKAMLKPSSLDYSDGNESSWILVTSYHKRNRRRAGSRAKPSSRKVNHLCKKRTSFPPKRGQNKSQVFSSSHKEKSKFNTKIGHKLARSTVQSLPVEFTAKPPVLVACAFEKAQLLVKATVTNPKVASLLAPSCADRGTTKAASLTLPALPVSPYESQVLHEIHSAANKDMPAHLVALPAVSVQPPDAVQSALEIDSMILLALQAASVVPLVLAIHSTACAAPSVVSAPPCQAAVAAALGQVTAYPALPAAHRKSANHSPGWRLQYKLRSTPSTAATGTCSQGGKVPFVSVWRLLYGMLFAMLLQLDLCGGAAAVAAGANPPPPPPPRHTLWKESPGADANTRGTQSATPIHPAMQSRLRGHTDLHHLSTRNHAVLISGQSLPSRSDSNTWVMTSASMFGAIACSNNGQHVVAGNYYGYLFTSNDYGATWNQSLSDEGYYLGIASSSDGQYWAAISHMVGIYTSSDYGNTWSLTTAAPIGWYSIASSANGQFLSAAAYNGSICTSNNNGQTWNVTSAATAHWLSIDSSESGQYLAAVAWNFGISTSNDYGATWISSPSVGNMYFSWYSITISSSGQNLAVLGDGSVYTSSDYGSSWQVTSPPDTYCNFFVATGHGHYLSGDYPDVFYSDDYGVTWAPSSVSYFALIGAALSGDGQYVFGYENDEIHRLTGFNDSEPSNPAVSPTLSPGPNPWQVTSAPYAFYVSIACSESGQYVVAGGHTGYLFSSNDYGVTWSSSLPSVGVYSDVTTSSDGQYWAVVAFNAGIYTSSDYGQSWSLSSAQALQWGSITSSSSGQFLYAVPRHGSIYRSCDFGQTWNITTNAVSVDWRTIRSSDSGQYIAAASTSNGLYRSSDYGATWVISNPAGSSSWNFITISKSGQYLAAAGDEGFYTSNDYGVSWTSLSDLHWNFVASNGDGRYLAGSSGSVYSSDDYGATWVSLFDPQFFPFGAALSTNGQYVFGYNSGSVYRMTRSNDTLVAEFSSEPSPPPTALSAPEIWQVTSAPMASWLSVACSDSGQYLIAVVYNGGIYTSNDYGDTWMVTNAPAASWKAVAISGNGQYLAAVAGFDVYTSTDFGLSWNVPSASTSFPDIVVFSSGGQFVAAIGPVGIYSSNDYGATWGLAYAPQMMYFSLALSSSGQHLAAGSWGVVSVSHDYGATWNDVNVGDSSLAVSSSDSGQYLVAGANHGSIYTSSDYGATWFVATAPVAVWYSVSSSSTGQYVVAGIGSGSSETNRMFTSSDYGRTWVATTIPHLPHMYFSPATAISSDGRYMFFSSVSHILRIVRPADQFPIDAEAPSIAPTRSPTAQLSAPTGCVAGTFNAQPGQPTALCAVCPGGTYSTEGMNSCLSCPAGSFSTAWSSSCTECPAGFYCLFGASAAVMCPSGTISNAGASSCTACPVGQYSYPGTSTCLTCSSA